MSAGEADSEKKPEFCAGRTQSGIRQSMPSTIRSALVIGYAGPAVSAVGSVTRRSGLLDAEPEAPVRVSVADA
ncbi:hypothetical protein BN11_650014 [Nostocoides australiense Ben110]|uniref:Uncharacterized protein n=1 Tax=Nostocoides australiense Ben110 TaxID=1193182 RepID=W6K2H7_9MICO|nr:hypothetical protein BN11_650014 [Tetrasphaera australiensis Ben110]